MAGSFFTILLATLIKTNVNGWLDRFYGRKIYDKTPDFSASSVLIGPNMVEFSAWSCSVTGFHLKEKNSDAQ